MCSVHCPDHPRELDTDEQGRTHCPFCKGLFLSEEGLLKLAPEALRKLTVEAREDAVVFKKPRNCPVCEKLMTPFRVGTVEQWVEKCPTCEHYWVDKQDLATLKMFARSEARQRAYSSLSDTEKKELASELAAAQVDPDRIELTTFQILLAALGVPVVSRTEGNRLAVVTWTIGVMLIVTFLAQKLDPDAFGMEQMAYVGGSGFNLALFSATFAHAGWLHLIGNLAFLFAFGDGCEQKWPWWMVFVAFSLGGALTLFIDGLFGTPGTLIVGASGGVSMLLGACVLLQPKAKVIYFVLRRIPVRVPMLVFGALELLYQLVMSMIGGSSGIAWVAHLAGMLLGIGLGLLTRAKLVPSPTPAV